MKKDRLRDVAVEICIKIILILSAIVLAVLWVLSAINTGMYAQDYANEIMIMRKDTILRGFWVMLMALGVVLLYLACEKRCGCCEKKGFPIFLLVTSAIMGILAIVYVAICRCVPAADQARVVSITAAFAREEYEDMLGYLLMYPQQYGLIFLMEPLWRAFESVSLFQYINVVLAIVAMCMMYFIGKELYRDRRLAYLVLVAMVLFCPLWLYVSYVYGELCYVSLGLVSIWLVIRLVHTNKLPYAICLVVIMAVCVLARKNALVLGIAIGITLMLCAIRQKQWLHMLVVVMMFAMCLGSPKLVERYYESRSGIEIQDGIPSVLWIAMGMQDVGLGAGVYNSYNNSTYWASAQCNTERAAEIGREYITERVNEFMSDIPMAIDFYTRKIAEQWCEPTYSALFMTKDRENMGGAFSTWLYDGNGRDLIIKWMNDYQMIIYGFAFVGVLFQLREKVSPEKVILYLVFLGGFLFSLIWEAKPRYVFPYVVFLLPCVTHGVMCVADKVIGCLGKRA